MLILSIFYPLRRKLWIIFIIWKRGERLFINK